MSILEQMQTLDADLSEPRFSGVVHATLRGVSTRDVNTKDGERAVIALIWELEEAVTATDGREFPPGHSLSQVFWISQQDLASKTGDYERVQRVVLAIRKLPRNTKDVPLISQDDEGSRAILTLKVTPNKKNPDEPYQNIYVNPVRE